MLGSLSPSSALLLPPSFSLGDFHSQHDEDDPFPCLYICPSLFTRGHSGQASETHTIDHRPDSGPQAGTALLFGLCDDFSSKKGGPSFPPGPGMAEVWFGDSFLVRPQKTHRIHWPHVWVTLG